MIDEQVCRVCQELMNFGDIANLRLREIRAARIHPRLNSAPLKRLAHPQHIGADGIARREMRSHDADATDGRLRDELIICSRHQMNLSWNIQRASRAQLRRPINAKSRAL